MLCYIHTNKTTLQWWKAYLFTVLYVSSYWLQISHTKHVILFIKLDCFRLHYSTMYKLFKLTPPQPTTTFKHCLHFDA